MTTHRNSTKCQKNATVALFYVLLLLAQPVLPVYIHADELDSEARRADEEWRGFDELEDSWGSLTAPVYGIHETGVYASAELFAGPNKFGNYFHGVLPNGRVVTPAGTSIQVGMNPLGLALTPDGRFLISTNDDERETGLVSYRNPANIGGYTLTVVDTSKMEVVSQMNAGGRFFVGLQVTHPDPAQPYTVWVSGGPDNDVKLFSVSLTGVISKGTPARIPISSILPSNQGFVSNYTPDAALNKEDSNGNKPPVPSGFSRTGSTKIIFPAGSALSPDQKYLYVACNGDNSVAVIDTALKTVIRQAAVGFFPYSVSVSRLGDRVFVSNWGITQYKFTNATYDAKGNLTALGSIGNQPDGFYVPVTSTMGSNPQTSSISVLEAPGGNGGALTLLGSVFEGHKLDQLYRVGDTHPSATAIVKNDSGDFVFVAKANSDSLGILRLPGKDKDEDADDERNGAGVRKLRDFDLSPLKLRLEDGLPIHGAYPNAIVASPHNTRLYVAEAGINSVAVLDVDDPSEPRLLGRIPTGWYPSALVISNDGRWLYVSNAKGIGEDINPATKTNSGNPPPSGIASDPSVDSNFIFGTVQQIDLAAVDLDNTTVLHNNFAVHRFEETGVVPLGDSPSKKIKHVFFILHENKTFDSMLGNLAAQFGPFSSTTYYDRTGVPYTNKQYTGVSLNTQLLAKTFATGVNFYSDSEESDAGHQFAASGTATDYTEKTLLVKGGRGLLVNKNFEPEDYPESGYIFNNAARHGVSFKDYGAMIRIEGTDTGTSIPTTLNDRPSDPNSGKIGYPQLQPDKLSVTNPLINLGDVTSVTQGLGQSYFLQLPVLAVLGGNNPNGEPRIDRNYSGYNFNVSDQRRALEFTQDFDRMVATGTLPQFLYIYQPNDHTGSVQAPNAAVVGTSPLQQIADGDVALGIVVNHIMKSPVYYNKDTGEGSAIFITYDDAQSSLDHIHPHRTPLIVVSPYAKPAFAGKKHYVTASIVKTEELLLGLPPNNLGDLLATDLRDLFQSTYNGITAADVPVTQMATYRPSPEAKRIWSLVRALDTSGPDRDSRRLGTLARLSIGADELHRAAARNGRLQTASYKAEQARLYQAALRVTQMPRMRDDDD